MQSRSLLVQAAAVVLLGAAALFTSPAEPVQAQESCVYCVSGCPPDPSSVCPQSCETGNVECDALQCASQPFVILCR